MGLIKQTCTALRNAALATLLALAVAATASTSTAQTLRYASAFDPNSLDPHALALLYQSRIVTQVYEGLVNRDREYRLEPALAVSWQQIDARSWRFKLRPDVRFHDGAPLTADDVVFSLERALAKTSQRAFQLRGISGARRVDALTVDVLLAAPDAVLPEKLYLIAIMSKAWAEKHSVLQPQDYNAKQETYAVRNANGTGPFRLQSYTPDQRLVLERNPTGGAGRRRAWATCARRSTSSSSRTRRALRRSLPDRSTSSSTRRSRTSRG